MPADDPPFDPRVARVPAAWLALYPDFTARLEAAHAAATPELRAATEAMLRALDARARRQEALLVSQFALTPAQARLAAHIRDGGALGDYAAANGIAESTARQHLKIIFQKAGVRRQAELVARLRSADLSG